MNILEEPFDHNHNRNALRRLSLQEELHSTPLRECLPTHGDLIH